MEELAIEEWKDVKGYEGFYLISNYGRVMSLRRKRYTGAESYYYQETRILKPYTDTYGYYSITLTNSSGKRRNHKIHRLIAQAFIENTEAKSCINHIDGDKKNNKINNLEWCTKKENNVHAVKTGLRKTFQIDKKLLKEDYLINNLSIEQIAKKYNTTYHSVAHKVSNYNLKKYNSIPVELVIKKLRNGEMQKDIARELNCSEAGVSQVKTKYLGGM